MGGSDEAARQVLSPLEVRGKDCSVGVVVV